MLRHVRGVHARIRVPKSFRRYSDSAPERTLAQQAPLFDADFNAKRRQDLERFASKYNATMYPPHLAGHLPLADFRARYIDIENGGKTNDKVAVVGRVMAKRESSSKLFFYDIQSDDSRLQVMANMRGYLAGEDHFGSINELLKRGDIIHVEGFPCRTKVGELSITPHRIQLLTPCLHHLPEPDTLKNPDLRYRLRYVDLLSNPSVKSAFVVRTKVINYVRNFLTLRKFMEVETPTLWPSVGGANARPFVARSNALSTDLYILVIITPLIRISFLRIAPELFLKQLVIGGFDKVFEIGKQFRNEGIDGTHNPEFTTCEFYEAYSDMYKLLDTTEELLRGIVKDVTGKEQVSTSVQGKPVTLDFSKPFCRISILPGIEAALGVKLPDVNSFDSVPQLLAICRQANLTPKEPYTPAKLLDFLISELLEPQCIQPTFLIEHPLALSPLAKNHRSQAGVTERFELMIAGKEICNAYSELNDPAEQRRRFEQQQREKNSGDDEAQVPDEEFCRALEVGLPPTGGWGMGIDRLVMLLTNSVHIRDVLLFPVMKPRTTDEHMEKV